MQLASKYFACIMYADDNTLLYSITPQDVINSPQLTAKINKTIKLINNWLKIKHIVKDDVKMRAYKNECQQCDKQTNL